MKATRSSSHAVPTTIAKLSTDGIAWRGPSSSHLEHGPMAGRTANHGNKTTLSNVGFISSTNYLIIHHLLTIAATFRHKHYPPLDSFPPSQASTALSTPPSILSSAPRNTARTRSTHGRQSQSKGSPSAGKSSSGPQALRSAAPTCGPRCCLR
jgi:hypothetical protein